MELKFEVIPDEQTPLTPEIEDVNKFIKDHKEEIKEFHKYADETSNAIGLAANQCSLNGERFNLRMVAVKDVDTKECIVAIDPKIKKLYGIPRIKPEGCLTWKGKTIIAKRYFYVDVEYYNLEGNLVEGTFKGFQGQVWQHEINHINGVEEEVLDGYVGVREEKTNRNDKCPCGSGKKYKQCCINDDKSWD